MGNRCIVDLKPWSKFFPSVKSKQRNNTTEFASRSLAAIDYKYATFRRLPLLDVTIFTSLHVGSGDSLHGTYPSSMLHSKVFNGIIQSSIALLHSFFHGISTVLKSPCLFLDFYEQSILV